MLYSRNLQEKYGWPSTKYFKSYIQSFHIINCLYLSDIVDIGEEVYGTSDPMLTGKMVKRKNSHVKNVLMINNIPSLLEKITFDELVMYYFHFNGITFFHTKTNKIKMTMFYKFHITGKEECIRLIDRVKHMNSNHVFIIGMYNGDNTFRFL